MAKHPPSGKLVGADQKEKIRQPHRGRKDKKMKAYHWSAESWGSGYPPINYEEICDAVNDYLDGIMDDVDEAEENIEYIWDRSEQLWEQFCGAGEIFGIKAEYND